MLNPKENTNSIPIAAQAINRLTAAKTQNVNGWRPFAATLLHLALLAHKKNETPAFHLQSHCLWPNQDPEIHRLIAHESGKSNNRHLRKRFLGRNSWGPAQLKEGLQQLKRSCRRTALKKLSPDFLQSCQQRCAFQELLLVKREKHKWWGNMYTSTFSITDKEQLSSIYCNKQKTNQESSPKAR